MSVLKSILSNSSRLSVSSRRPEDVKMLRLALYSERAGQCVLFILFVLDDELFCLKDAVLSRRPRISSSLFMITVVF